MLSYIEINKENLLHNFNQFRSLVYPDTKIISMVKANAYGHGLKEVVKILKDHTDLFAVDDIEELRELRKYTRKPTLVIDYVPKDSLVEIVELNAELGLFDIERAQILNKIAKAKKKVVKIHIKVDTFLGRQGLLLEDLDIFITQLRKLKMLHVEAVYSHFSNIGESSDYSHTYRQLECFERAVEIFRTKGYPNIRSHISKTAGILMFERKRKHHDYVRLGVGLYGLWPEEEIRKRYEKTKTDLTPVLRWVTHIAQVKTVPKNYPIGYGLAYVTKKKTKIAVIPQGYSDGYDRGLSNSGEVLIHGERCKVLGRVSMNVLVVDVSHLKDVRPEDEVVLLGSQEKDVITAEEIAEKIGTINYEVVARINPLLPRNVCD